MKFGTFFCHQLPRPWTEGAERRLFKDALAQVELADRLGYDYAWGQEHHFLEEYAHSSAPEVFLAAFSQRTRRIRIGHGIVLAPPAYNPPARVAERIATLDLVSDGRVEWGTGESASRIELDGFGIKVIEKREMWLEAVRETARMMAATPYPGYEGRFFRMPARNVVPKPLQKPHPPIWVACSNRESVKHAARMGIGALTFAFMNPEEARYWVAEYYDTFKRECSPIGRTVNPNIAMLTNFMCHADAAVARERGERGAAFFAYGLSHYYRTGTHVPGAFDLWDDFVRAGAIPHGGGDGIGTPADIADRFRAYEEAGLDQLILLHQAGGYQHAHICESLELFGRAVMPAFKERDAARQRRKEAELAPYVAAALARVPPIEVAPAAPVASFPVLARQHGVEVGELAQRRAVLPATVWRLHVGGRGDQR